MKAAKATARPSRQLSDYRAYRAHGHSTADAAAAAGILVGEARLVDKDEGL